MYVINSNEHRNKTSGLVDCQHRSNPYRGNARNRFRKLYNRSWRYLVVLPFFLRLNIKV
jgi:hypothetical protein